MTGIGKVAVFPKLEENVVEWKIHNFLSISQEVGNIYHSPVFYFKGESWLIPPWSLWIHPNGYNSKLKDGFIYLSLLRRDSGTLVGAKVSFALKTVNGKKDVEKRGTNYFGKDGFYTVRLISRSDFARRQSEFVASGSLTVICTVKLLKSTESAHKSNGSESDNESESGSNSESESDSEDKGHSSIAKSSSNKRKLDADEVSSHEKKCMHKYVKCLECSELINSQTLCESQMASVKVCSYCGENIDPKNMSLHEKKCMGRMVACSSCSEFVLKKDWNDHPCLYAEEDETSTCEDLKEMLLNGINHDLVLRVGDIKFIAHQDILRARSQVFKSMLSLDKKQEGNAVIEIHDCDPQAMKLFLCYIYTGKLDSEDQSNMLKLYYIANKYDMKGLIRNCRTFIKKSLSNANIYEVIPLAFNHNDSSLLEHVAEYFKDNALDIMHTLEWQTFMKANLTTANELIMKSFQKLKNAST